MFRKNLLVCMVAWVLLLGTSHANTTSVWKLEKNGNTIYLAGTMHLLKEGDYPLPNAFHHAFDNSKVLVLETDVGQLSAPSFQQKLQTEMLLPQGQTLDQFLSDSTLKQAQQFANSRGIPLQAMSAFKASFVGLTFAVVELQQLGLTQVGVDQFFHDKAKQEAKQLAFLETPAQQIRFLANLADGDEDAYIRYTLKDIEKLPEYLDKMHHAWRNGQPQYFEQELIPSMVEDFPSIYQSLLVTRNKNWMPTLLSYFNTEETEAVFVGTLHLPGSDGLLNMLAKHGVKATQL
ncbi:MAG: TraB/GumN family protein [Alteromonadaceae bacterium]|nr:TraB/GumN family protein [Alteromonadaceae bacterium]